MAILKIARMGHPVLSRIAAPVTDPTAPEIKRLVADMIETMEDAQGAGLAAPQVHVPLRVVVFQAPGERSKGGLDENESFDHTAPLTVLINPVIEVVDATPEGGWEGCLSVPGLRGWVERARHIRYAGYGTDGTIWGGEILAADLLDFDRMAHLRPLRLPGGDAAARDTARCGLALLYQALGDDFAGHPAARMLVPDDARRTMLCRMIRSNVCCATSSGAGRVFDGVAALLGICRHNHFEAQAAMALEAAAHRAASGQFSGCGCRTRASVGSEALFELGTQGGCRVIDLSRLIRVIAESRCAAESAARSEELALLFHETLAQALATAALEASQRSGIRTIGLSGGVFCNVIFTRRITALLEASGMRVLRHCRVPANDGGLSLGQAAIAAAATATGSKGA